MVQTDIRERGERMVLMAEMDKMLRIGGERRLRRRADWEARVMSQEEKAGTVRNQFIRNNRDLG